LTASKSSFFSQLVFALFLDGHIVFHTNDRPRGFTEDWRDGESQLRTARTKGIVFDTWNGYTEGFVAVPTREDGDVVYQWLQQLFR
jgi:hypothetical protein